MIMVEGGKGENKGRYVIEKRIDELIDELNIDKSRITKVFHKSATWNIWMMIATAVLCAFSITPYIYLNSRANNLNLTKGTIWVFPILRSTGGFITASFIQLLIKQRIITISDQYLVKKKRDQQGNGDVGEARAVETMKYQMDARTWPLLCLLLLGLLASVVGYVGCFSIVQNSASTSGTISWLCLEAGLSVARLIIWARNPTCDDAPPLKIKLELDKYEPLPTCNKDNADILEYKVLPLTRARDFLKSITSFVGLIKPFSNPDLSLYYTLTWNRQSKKRVSRRNGDIDPENAEKHELGERTLYITILDHKERTTRVYTRDDDEDTFYSTKLDAPLVDVGHHLLEVEIDAEIDSEGDDPVCRDKNILGSLREHHQSILKHIQLRLGAGDVTKRYAIENSWTMKAEDTISTLKEGNGEAVDEKGREKEGREEEEEDREEEGREERTSESLASDYFLHSSTEKERRLLDEKRVKWIARRMDMITKEMEERVLGVGVEYRDNMQAVKKKLGTKSPEVKRMLSLEQYGMELLLVCEVREWEQLFWDKFKAFLVEIDKYYRKEERERLEKEWKANCWKRLNTQKHAALKRMANVDMDLEGLGKQWAFSISLLFKGVDNPDISSLSDLRRWIGGKNEETRLRIEKEIEDTKFRLQRGLESGRFDQFWDDDTLFECRYSRSKWVYLSQFIQDVPLEVYSHALKRNRNIIHITFGYINSDFDVNQFLCDLPWVTSISPDRPVSISAIHHDLLFIKSTNSDLKKFAKEIKLDPSSTYIFSDAGISALYSGLLRGNARVLISFLAPTSGKRLILRVKHSGEEYAPLEVTLGSTKIKLNPSSMSSLTIDNITLYPIEVSDPSESDHLSFKPEVRNDIFIQFIGYRGHGHFLHDVELLGEGDLEYMPRSASFSKLSN